MAQETFARRPQTMFNDFRYPMPVTDKPVDGAKYPARWSWEEGLDGKIYFKVVDGIWGAEDKNAKSKEVEMCAMDRNSLFNLMKEACDNTNFTKAQYNVKRRTFGSGGRLNDHPSVLATFTVVRTQEGKIAVAYRKGTYQVTFPFVAPFESTIVIPSDGEPKEDHGLMSRVYCIAFIDFCAKFLDDYEFTHYKPRERKDGNGNGGNRTNNNSSNNNNNGSRQAPPNDFDIDIDF